MSTTTVGTPVSSTATSSSVTAGPATTTTTSVLGGQTPIVSPQTQNVQPMQAGQAGYLPLPNISFGIDTISNFTGRQNVHEFLNSIEVTSTLFNWNDETKATILKMKLKGQAFDFLLSDRGLINSRDWSDLKTKLVKHSAPRPTPYQAVSKFNGIRQFNQESVNEYVLRIKKAGKEIIKLTGDPVTDIILQENLDRMLLTQFINGLYPPLREKVMYRGVHTLLKP